MQQLPRLTWLALVLSGAALVPLAKASFGGFICLPKPVKFGACTSIRLLGSCQEDSDCDTRVCCKDWCGNYCAFKQRAYAVDNRRRPTDGDDLLPMKPIPQRPRGDSDGPDRTDQRSSEGEDDGGSRRRRGRYRRRHKRVNNRRRRMESGTADRRRMQNKDADVDRDEHEYLDV